MERCLLELWSFNELVYRVTCGGCLWCNVQAVTRTRSISRLSLCIQAFIIPLSRQDDMPSALMISFNRSISRASIPLPRPAPQALLQNATHAMLLAPLLHHPRLQLFLHQLNALLDGIRGRSYSCAFRSLLRPASLLQLALGRFVPLHFDP